MNCRSLVLDAIAEVAPRGRAIPTGADERELSEFGVDSVGVLEVVSVLEEKLDVIFPDHKVARARTFRDLQDLVEEARPDLACVVVGS